MNQVFTKENSVDLSTLSDVQINQLNKDTRIWFYCENCNKLAIKRVAAYRLDYKKLCRKCKQLDHLGYSNNFQAPDFLEKKKKAFEKKFGSYRDGYKACREKAEKTNLEKYGTVAPLQNEKVKEKQKETNNKRYGYNSPSQNKAIKQKQIETTIKNWGYKSSAQSPLIKEKAKQTCLKRYGVPSGFLTRKCFDSHSRYKYFFEGETFDSSWELAVWIYCKENNISIKREPIKLLYEFNGKVHAYFPDFEIDGKLVEIKGDQFFDKNGKMICPFDRNQDEFFEAKHKFGLEKGVVFWKNTDIEPYILYVQNTKGKDFLKSCIVQRVYQKFDKGRVK